MNEENFLWGCPDWRDAAAYPESSDDLQDWEWRWQFMRRWPVYRDLFCSLPPFLAFSNSDRYRTVGQLSREESGRIWHLTNMLVMRNPTLNRLERNPFNSSVGGGTLFRMPARAYWDDIEEKRQFESLLGSLEDRGLVEGVPSPFAYVKFDLTRPLQSQIKNAELELEKLAGRKRAHRLGGKDRELWPTYLRVIDAKDQGATNMVIYDHLFAEIDQSKNIALHNRMAVGQPLVLINNWIKAATKLMNTASIFL